MFKFIRIFCSTGSQTKITLSLSLHNWCHGCIPSFHLIKPLKLCHLLFWVSQALHYLSHSLSSLIIYFYCIYSYIYAYLDMIYTWNSVAVAPGCPSRCPSCGRNQATQLLFCDALMSLPDCGVGGLRPPGTWRTLLCSCWHQCLSHVTIRKALQASMFKAVCGELEEFCPFDCRNSVQGVTRVEPGRERLQVQKCGAVKAVVAKNPSRRAHG